MYTYVFAYAQAQSLNVINPCFRSNASPGAGAGTEQRKQMNTNRNCGFRLRRVLKKRNQEQQQRVINTHTTENRLKIPKTKAY